MALYSRAMDLKLALPRRPDTMTPGAIAAVERMRAAPVARRVEAEMAKLVAPRPLVKPESAPPGLLKVQRLAEAHGWTVKLYESETGHALQGRRGDLGFRAFWQYGKTTGATWHERTPRWTLVDDPRPIRMNTRDRVGLKDFRSEGMGRARLKLLAAPWGLPLNVTELTERLNTRGLTYEKGKWT